MGESFTVKLSGTLKYEYLPLADKALVFEEACVTSCTIILPPVEYSVNLTSSDKESISDTLSLSLGEEKKYSITFADLFSYRPLVENKINSITEKGLIENAISELDWKYTHIGTGRGWRYLALREKDQDIDIGILTLEKFLPIIPLPIRPIGITLDLSRQYIIMGRDTSDQYIVSLDGQDSRVFDIPEKIQIVDLSWNSRVLTVDGVYELIAGKWKKNPRFTDYIDLSPTRRLGYIDKNDILKLSLQNLSPWVSVIQLIERDTGKSTIIKIGLDIQWFVHVDGKVGFLDMDGNIQLLETYQK